MSLNNFVVIDDDDDENGGPKTFEPYLGREGVIFLVDCRESMFKEGVKNSSVDNDQNFVHENIEGNYSAFNFALLCCKEFMLNKIKQSDNTLISVVFFGIGKGSGHRKTVAEFQLSETTSISVVYSGVEKGSGNRKNVVEFQSLATSSLNKIKELNEIIVSKSHKGFKRKYSHSENSSLTDALSYCMYSFTNCSVKIGMKRILLFTNDDNPDAEHPDKQLQIRKRADDLSKAGIDLDLLPIGPDFNVQLFYQEIIQIIKKDDYEIPTSFDDISDALDAIHKDNHKRRRLSCIKFHLGNEIMIGVSIYRFTRRLPKFVKKKNLSGETNEQVTFVRGYLNAKTGEKLRPYDILKVTNKGGKSISFTSNELSKIGNEFKPQMTLLGFKPKEFWKVEYHYKQPFFIFPDESIVKGSRQLFVALWKQCIERDKIALCSLTVRKGSRPIYVVLIPQKELFNERQRQETPDGFHVCALPFANMYGNIPMDSTKGLKPNETERAVAKKLVNRLKIKKFYLDFFANPIQEKHWVTLEAVALQRADARPFEDTTMVYHEKLSDKLQDLVEKFNAVFVSKARNLRGTKHKSDSHNTCSVKIPKRSEFIDLATQRKIDKLTIPQLKKILQFVPQIRVAAAKKSDLVDLVYKKMYLVKKNFP